MWADAAINATDVDRLLTQAQACCTPPLQQAVARLAPPLDQVVGYHFGWLDVHGRPVDGRRGKSVRAALALLSAEAAGARPEAGIPGGVAVELIHNFSLVHDDLMDRDERRRHRATVWSVFGEEDAVLAGDALFTLAIEVVLDAGRDADATDADVGRAVRRITRASRRLIDGQAQDLTLERRDRATVAECLQMAGDKTGALMAVSSSIGGVLAGIGEAEADALEQFGHRLGLAFQAVDDLLGIWGSAEITGKPRWSDLRRGKKSLPVTAALAADGTAARRLAELFARPQQLHSADDAQLANCAELIVAAGGRDWTRQQAAQEQQAALDALDAVHIPAPVREKLTALARFVVARQELIDGSG